MIGMLNILLLNLFFCNYFHGTRDLFVLVEKIVNIISVKNLFYLCKFYNLGLNPCFLFLVVRKWTLSMQKYVKYTVLILYHVS